MSKARQANPTVTFIDEYCRLYQDLFPDVRSFEHFKFLHVGMLSDIKRKTLPAIAKVAGDLDPQALHHFVANAPWSVEELRTRRLTLLRQALAGRSFVLCIDETGDRKKGHTTDYVAHQYVGNLGKLANGIVSVNAYGILDHITFPLVFKIYKPRTRLQPGDTYKTKPQLAVELIQELQQWDFHFEVVLTDSLYGESGDFISELEKLHLRYVVAIRSNHGVWLPPGQRVRYTNWRPFERIFSNGEHQTRYIRELVFGQRGRIRYYHLTTDPQTLPPESTWYIMTNLEGNIRKTIGNTYGLRTWIEYGFKQAKNELGWADYRVTDYASIERWWELISSTYLLVSLQSHVLQHADQEPSHTQSRATITSPDRFSEHRWWDGGQGWKNILNNLRLILQPYVSYWLLLPWVLLFDLSGLRAGFRQLISIMNSFHATLPT
ncbi:MAG: IS701 family transposase [Ktedonobacteraceae bacterium]